MNRPRRERVVLVPDTAEFVTEEGVVLVGSLVRWTIPGGKRVFRATAKLAVTVTGVRFVQQIPRRVFSLEHGPLALSASDTIEIEFDPETMLSSA